MEIPRSRIDQVSKLLLYPGPFSAALEEHEAVTGEKPWALWKLILCFTLLGTACYGITLGLLVDSWPILGSVLTLVAAWGAGWIVFLRLALKGKEGPPPWLRFHFAVAAMVFGELVLECGILLNLLFWWTDWLSETQAKGMAIVWLLLVSVTMLMVLTASWRSRDGGALGKITILWLLVFQGTVAGVFLGLGSLLEVRF